jgi:acyl-coenzyme A thioesterase PaaI-like protein
MEAPEYTPTHLTAEEAAEHDRVLGALAAATGRLADAQLRTQVDLDEAETVTRELEALTDRLLLKTTDGSLGVELGPGEGEVRVHGNAAIGLRNAFAPVRREDRTVEGTLVRYEVDLGAGYEGPPGLVHGGVSALVLDEVLGDAAAVGGGPGMTGRLTISYRRPTPLGRVVFEGWCATREGRKTTVRGHVKDAEGNVTVEAEALFILPRWAEGLAGFGESPAGPAR